MEKLSRLAAPMIMKKLILIAISILSLNWSLAWSQDFTFSEEGQITLGTTLSIQSEILSEERKILVSLPEGYQDSTRRYPVVYILDAQYFFQFQYAYGVINALEFMEEIPEVILVGVYSEDRDSDLMTASTTENRGGNADKLIEFFRSELQVCSGQVNLATLFWAFLYCHSAA